MNSYNNYVSYSFETTKPEKINYYKLYERNPTYAAIRFILECCQKLELKPSTFAHAATIFHRFHKNLERSDYDKFATATASIFLGSKVNENELRLKDLINVSQVTLNREEFFNEMTNNTWILSIRDTIVQCEMFIMRVLDFSPQTTLPHIYLLNYINTLENWLPDEIISQIPISKCAMSLLQDFFYNSNIVSYAPDEIALAVLVATFQIYGLKIPLIDDHDTWFKIFNPDMKIDLIWEIIDELLKVFEVEEGVQNLL
ncbi:hypothetical protein PVAND_010247 [Polypedilum vanderplanki]|uniref:Cyclin-Q n=1 Tax=Polypedilum vanderplanki TaxID=319348 RepID=A0A9J6CG37_POLVA|nr:hypothetical protein PVAND_010247 [Polypedilum vanderplanki]